MKASSSGSQLCPDRMLVGVNSVGTASKGKLTPWIECEKWIYQVIAWMLWRALRSVLRMKAEKRPRGAWRIRRF